ncbi:hypothetical protein TVTCOM_36780 [Terrisporobacter vanillatitrophus]
MHHKTIRKFITKGKLSTNKVRKYSRISDKEQYTRISNTLIAVMNCKDSSLVNSTINMKYYEKENKLRIMLWGTMKITIGMMSIVSTLTKDDDL